MKQSKYIDNECKLKVWKKASRIFTEKPLSDLYSTMNKEWDPLTMGYFDNLDNESLNKY
jgi:hypothetical protein